MHAAESCLFWHASIRGVQPHHTYVCVYLCVCVCVCMCVYILMYKHTGTVGFRHVDTAS